MLNEIKKSYEEYANLFPNWKNYSKSDLCNKYILLKEQKDPLADACLSAIIYKFWHVIEHQYNSSHGNIFSEQEYYDTAIDSIMYALNSHVWTKKTSKLYEDKNAPEKVINIVLHSRKNSIYAYANMDKRKLNFGILSLEQLEENSSDAYFIPYTDNISIAEDIFGIKIKDAFDSKQYFKAFLYDAILHANVFNKNTNMYSLKQTCKHLHNISDEYLMQFAGTYGYDMVEVKTAYYYINNIDTIEMTAKIKYLLLELSKDKKLLSVLKD